MTSNFISAPEAKDYPALVAVWEAAVRSSHDFIDEADIVSLREALSRHYLPAVTLRVWRDIDGVIQGFIGVHQRSVEMLFVAPEAQGTGIGRRLLDDAVAHFNINALDVNEQNPRALAFYRRYGFHVVGRSPRDGQGRPYPLLHLALHSHQR